MFGLRFEERQVRGGLFAIQLFVVVELKNFLYVGIDSFGSDQFGEFISLISFIMVDTARISKFK
jgi:hypothetical protein